MEKNIEEMDQRVKAIKLTAVPLGYDLSCKFQKY